MKKTILFRTFKTTEASFPFEKTHSTSLFPVGNIPNLVRLVRLVSEQNDQLDFRVLVAERPSDYRFHLQDLEVEFFDSLEPALADLQDVVVIDSDRYFTKEMIEIILQLPANTLLVQSKSEQFKSIHGMGIETQENQVTKVIGHGRDHYVDYMLAGAMVLNHEVLKNVGKTPLGMDEISTGGMPYQKLYLENVVQQALYQGALVHFKKTDDLVLDLSYPWHLLQANQLETKTSFESSYDQNQVDETCVIKGSLVLGKNSRIEHHCIIKGNVRVGDNTLISSGVVIEGDVIIGNDCVIQNYALITKNTVIGHGVKLGFHAEVGGVLMNRCAIVHQCEVYGVIGRRVDVGAGTLVGTLRFDDQETSIRVQGRLLANKSTSVAFIGDYSRTGIGNIILPGVRIGSYCSIGPGAVLEKDIDHEQLVLVQQEKHYRAWSPAKYGWKK